MWFEEINKNCLTKPVADTKTNQQPSHLQKLLRYHPEYAFSKNKTLKSRFSLCKDNFILIDFVLIINSTRSLSNDNY